MTEDVKDLAMPTEPDPAALARWAGLLVVARMQARATGGLIPPDAAEVAALIKSVIEPALVAAREERDRLAASGLSECRRANAAERERDAARELLDCHDCREYREAVAKREAALRAELQQALQQAETRDEYHRGTVRALEAVIDLRARERDTLKADVETMRETIATLNEMLARRGSEAKTLQAEVDRLMDQTTSQSIDNARLRGDQVETRVMCGDCEAVMRVFALPGAASSKVIEHGLFPALKAEREEVNARLQSQAKVLGELQEAVGAVLADVDAFVEKYRSTTLGITLTVSPAIERLRAAREGK